MGSRTIVKMAEGKVSVEDRRFLEVAKNGIQQRPDGHFEMPLTFQKNIQLPNNKVAAMKRLGQLRMLKDKKYREDYTAFMEDVIQKGHAEIVPPAVHVIHWALEGAVTSGKLSALCWRNSHT